MRPESAAQHMQKMNRTTQLVIVNQSVRTGTFSHLLMRWRQRLLALALIIFPMQAAKAAVLTWDPANTGNGATIDAGSGTWDTSTAIWNNGSGDVAWSQTSPTVPLNTSLFGGADGTYLVTVGATQIATTNLTFNNSGYTLTGGTLYIAHTADGQNELTVAANKTATFTNITINSSGQQNTFIVNSGATLNLNLGCTLNSQSLFSGGGTINMNGGTIAPGAGFFQTKGCVFNHKGGNIITTGGSASYLGYGGNSFYTNSGGTYVINGGGSMALSRGGVTATLTLQNGGSMYLGTNGTAANLFLASSDNSSATEKSYVDVQGGTLTVGTSASAGKITLMSAIGASGQLASFIAEGGVVNAWGGFQFGGGASAYAGGAIASLLVSNTAAVYLGSNGIVEMPFHPTDTITFSGGTVGALTNWSTMLPINFGNSGGPVTIRAADASSVSNNISMSGALTGSQGFIKTGAGILTLGGTNTYTGSTVINAGTVALGANASISNSARISIVAGATMDVSAITVFAASTTNKFTASGTGTTVGSTAATMVGNASGTVDLGTNNITLNYDGSNPALYVAQGALSLGGNVWTVNGALLLTTGTNIIARVASGNINSNGVPTVNGTAVTASTAHIQFSGGDVQLVVTAVSLPINVNNLTANSKIYDATTATTINTNGYTLNGVQPADVGNVYLVTNGYTANFADANAGVGKAVTVTGLSLGGSAAGNYFIVPPVLTTANITNASTTLTLTCPQTNIYSGWQYIFQASLSSTGWLPTNQLVTFTTNNVTLGTATLTAPSLATLFATLSPGTYTVTAGYPGNANVIGSTNSLTVTLGTLGTASGFVFDGNTNVPGAQDGSGTWDAASTADWFNGTADNLWNSAGAVFGAGTDGTNYLVTLPGTVAATSLTFNNSGYTLTNGQINLGTGAITVAANKTNTVNSIINYSGNSQMQVNGVLNLGGGMASTTTFNVASGLNGGGAINFTAGTYNMGGATYLSASNFNQTGGAVNFAATGASGSWINYSIGRKVTYTISGGSLNVNGTSSAYLSIGRANATNYMAQLTVQNGGTVNIGTTGDGGLNLGQASGNGTLDIQGGTLTVGTANTTYNQIYLLPSGSVAGSTNVMQQEGGLATVQGIQFGATSLTTYNLPAIASLTLTGGSLYLGALGITEQTYHATDSVTFSGGTVGAFANWAANLPITLGTNNGNVTFQCADTNGTSYNITLQKGATGAGGLNVTGAGTLALGGALNYSGSTVVSNGTLVLGTTLYPLIGNPLSTNSVTLDGSTGTHAPTLSVTENAGQYWSIGALSFINGGLPAMSLNFGSLAPSASVAPIQVVGNVDFTTTPALTVSGTSIAVGIYPLIKYTGSVSGTAPTTATLPGYVSSGYITNISSTKTIALVVTGSSYNPALYWGVGNGQWDINTSLNWNQFSSPVKYTEGSAVVFDDTASGSSPITVTLNTTVNPFSVTVNNTTNKSFTITGTGGIAGSAAMSLLGSGTFTLAGTNTYSGGTTVSAGQLNINNGGDNSGLNSAIGTGPLTLDAGVKLDNTSGSDVTLNPNNTETWNGGFTYLGSTNGLNTGAGSVTLGQSLTLTVSNNIFNVGGSISDSGANYTLTKTGNGTLTLGNNNTIGGGVTLSAGQLNLGSSGSLGSGIFQINGGSLDNVSGSDMTVSPSQVKMFGSFTYLGSTNNLDLGSGTVSLSTGLIVTVATNTLTTEGDLNGGNFPITKAGNGTWNIIGSGTIGSGSSMIVNAGTVNFGKSSGWVIKSTSGANPGLTINSNAQVVITAGNQQILNGGSFAAPVKLNGGVLDLNGHNQIVDSLLITNSGTLRMSANYATLTVGAVGGKTLTIGGTNCTFDVPGPELDIAAAVAGNGSLLKTGTGLLNLYSNFTYTGSTIVSDGTLQINHPSLATNSLVSIATNGSAVLNLNFASGETNIVGSLVIGGTTYPPGVYNANTDPTYIIGSGSLLVLSVAPAINPLPGTIQVHMSVNTLGLSWPTNSGWILQSQTNSLNSGLGGNWVDVSGSSSTTNANISVVPANPAVFYRLRHP